jgi:DNA-binding MarR family transcriptional regulator
VSGLADRLERLELIQRRPSAKDRRRTELDLTEVGKAKLQSLSEEHRAELRRLRPTLSGLLAEL